MGTMLAKYKVKGTGCETLSDCRSLGLFWASLPRSSRSPGPRSGSRRRSRLLAAVGGFQEQGVMETRVGSQDSQASQLEVQDGGLRRISQFRVLAAGPCAILASQQGSGTFFSSPWAWSPPASGASVRARRLGQGEGSCPKP